MEQEVMNQHYRNCGLMKAYGEHALEIRNPEVSQKPQKWTKAVLPLHPHRRAGVLVNIYTSYLEIETLFHLSGCLPCSLVVSR